jgi:gamma-glutamyl-gamma-aminobutyrate hydrolase PuuD
VKKVLLVYRELAKVRPYAIALHEAGVDLEIVAASGPVTLDGFAGLLLMGGTDVDPKLYGEASQPETDPPDRQLDEIELSLIRGALERDLSILAICRGLQLLNVYHGGSLIQHLHSLERHQQTEGNQSLPVHEVRIASNTLLAAIAGVERWSVNSRHHQAVKALGKDLLVSAIDPEDGTVEALERPDRSFVVGVQWHPEDQALLDPDQIRIFRSFGAKL